MIGNASQSMADIKLPTCKERCGKDQKNFAFLYKSQEKNSVLFPEMKMFPVESSWMISRENPHQLVPVQVPTSIALCTWIFSLTFSTNWICLQELLKNLFLPQPERSSWRIWGAPKRFLETPGKRRQILSLLSIISPLASTGSGHSQQLMPGLVPEILQLYFYEILRCTYGSQQSSVPMVPCKNPQCVSLALLVNI